MLIPVKCFTCGNVLANKYRFYLREVEKKKLDKSINLEEVQYLNQDTNDKTPEGEVMDMLELDKYCCRRHMLTHVDIE
jgi:DNA-directed RNA polymerase I, II, and III subunit RPABC5